MSDRTARSCGTPVNTHLPFLSEMPHGGFGQSGYGKDLSINALEEYKDQACDGVAGLSPARPPRAGGDERRVRP